MRLFVFVSLVLLLLDSSQTVESATIHVPGDQPNIQAGVDAAMSGDTIVIASGVFTGDGNRDIVISGDGLTLVSDGGPASTIIDCEASFEDKHRAFYLDDPTSTTVTVSGLTVRNGNVTQGPGPEREGGGIFVRHGLLTLRNCVIELCEASEGTGVYIEDGSAVLEDCVIQDMAGDCVAGSIDYLRVADSRFESLTGNAIAFRGDSVVVEGSVFASITGDAVIATGGALRIDSSSFQDVSGNGVRIDGSGLHLITGSQFTDCSISAHVYSGQLNIQCCTFDVSSGRAVWVQTTQTAVDSCMFLGNGSGGGFGGCCASSVSISNCQFIRCDRAIWGSDYFSADITSCTFFGCSDAVFLAAGASIDLTYCILAYGPSGLPAITDSSVWGPTEPQLTCCDVFGNAEGDWVGIISDQAGMRNNFSADPLFCDTAALDLSVDHASPCAPSGNACESQIGAGSPGCRCCFSSRGNVDNAGDPGIPSIGDLTRLVDFLFISLTPPECWEEANVDNTPPEGPGSVTLSDFDVLVDHLFISLDPLPPCP
ncbi:hypothetical protein GF377_00395 [candidate division GN15 bacterium]|nr:hypothetical protein [candidate division GN15 bacterium]